MTVSLRKIMKDLVFKESSVMRSLFVVLLMLLFSFSCYAVELSVPTIFTDNVILQREKPVPVWGKAAVGATVKVEFGRQQKIGVANEEGSWRVELAALQASSKPQSLLISSGNEEIKIDNVLVGEVWFCSGQSNMELALRDCENAKEAMASANNPDIRLYYTPRVHSGKPLDRIDSKWEVCTPDSIERFSGVAYFFGRKLNKDLDVPVGLLLSSWGGTRIDPWIPPCGFSGIEAVAHLDTIVQNSLPDNPVYKDKLNQYLEDLDKWMAVSKQAVENEEYISAPPVFPSELILGDNNYDPTRLYNGMIHAHVPFPVRGAIWYQGEANHHDGMEYVDKTRALLNGWYKVWGYEFPFYFVQITPYQYGNEDPEILARFWEVQSQIVKDIPNTGMAVVSDYTTINNIHPPNKLIPGERLALLAEANTYGMDVICTGPVFREIKLDGDVVRVYFDNAEGLTTNNGKAPDWFEVAGIDREFEKAETCIDGSTVVVKSAEVPEPKVVRFAWHKLATPNLVNVAGIPAAAFRAGKFPPPENPARSQVPEAEGFRVVYQIDIPVDADYGNKDPEYFTDVSDKYQQFDKVGYYLELTGKDGSQEYVFASMNKFTDDLKKIGIPVVSSGSYFFQKVQSLTVRSNVPEVLSCTGSDGGSIEFCPSNYQTVNSSNIPGAVNDKYDFGESGDGGMPGYGSMQIHNWRQKQTIFAINHWGTGGNLDVGIGNSPEGNSDWTFKSNGPEYERIRLTVMVK